jgi:hypothetical protein
MLMLQAMWAPGLLREGGEENSLFPSKIPVFSSITLLTMYTSKLHRIQFLSYINVF